MLHLYTVDVLRSAGIAETYLMKAVGQCTGRSVAQVKAAVQKVGDLGAAAAAARESQRTMFAVKTLTCRRVFEALKEIANMTGESLIAHAEPSSAPSITLSYKVKFIIYAKQCMYLKVD